MPSFMKDNPIVMLIGVAVVCVPLGALVLFFCGFFEKNTKHKNPEQFYSNRWMTKSEANTKYIFTKMSQLKMCKKTGVLCRFEIVGKDVEINMVSKDYHSIVLGTTGSGKTQGFVLPYVYTLGHSAEKPNIVITDPKGEIYANLAETLRRQGYNVQVFNLSEPTKSSRWNPLEPAWDMFQRAYNLEGEIKKRSNVDPKTLGLRVIASQYPKDWYEFNKIAFPTYSMADMERKTLQQRLLSDAESDVKDICAAMCPVENEKDKSWEEGARDLIQATILAMLEDSRNPNLGMTKERFNFYNVYKILGTRDTGDSMFATLKKYFDGRDKLSPAVQLSQTVMANVDKTMQNFFGVVTQKLALFADKGICYITSGTEISFEDLAKKPTVLFLIIPDQIKIRHTLATLCLSQLYKAIVRMANERGGKMPWLTHYVMDEFGNMPKLNDFATMVTVSRSRGVRLNMVIQDYKQLETTYGPSDAVTIRNNCNIQIFIGVNDAESRKIFSELMGEMAITLKNENVSKTTGKAAEKDKDGGSISTSTQVVSRPLLPPNELLDMKPGQIYVYVFGFNPLRSVINPFHQSVSNNLVVLYKEPDRYVESKYFDEGAIFYDVKLRNDVVFNKRGGSAQAAAASFEW